jgi:pimeloyl-ACP methyl ester carboxylesterase
VCDHLSIAGAIVVGHSLGGAVAVQVAATRPDLAAAVVMLDGALLFRDEVVEGVAPLFEAVQSPAWREAVRLFVDTSFIPTDDPEVREAAHARGWDAPRGSATSRCWPRRPQVAAMIDQFVVTSPPDHAAA